VRSDEVEIHPESPLVPVTSTSPFPAPSRPASPTTLHAGRDRIDIGMLRVEGLLMLDSSIVAYVVSVSAFAISRGESILEVQLGVFRASEG